MYCENYQEIALLLSVDEERKTAYIVDYLGSGKKAILEKSEKLAQFYGIEGYRMSFLNAFSYKTAQESDINYKNIVPEYDLAPY
ncbi:hypothetical protein, partial [Pradoshia sp.]